MPSTSCESWEAGYNSLRNTPVCQLGNIECRVLRICECTFRDVLKLCIPKCDWSTKNWN